jgi:hemerythrin-like domain-containing protein
MTSDDPKSGAERNGTAVAFRLDAPPPPLACVAPDPIGVIEEEHALHRELCDLLEAIADALPGKIDRALADIAVSLLDTSVPHHIQLEEEALFPLLRARASEGHQLYSVLQCLEQEHESDLGFSGELSDTLRSVAEGTPPSNSEMLGYMLRGYFESQRRHLAWEDSVVLPAARELLTPADLLNLQDWIMRSGRPRCTHQSVMAIRAARSVGNVCKSCQCGGARTATN